MFKIVHIPALLEVKDSTISIQRFKLQAIISFDDWIDDTSAYGTIYFRSKAAAMSYLRKTSKYKIVTDMEPQSIELYRKEECYEGDSLKFKKTEFMIEEASDV